MADSLCIIMGVLDIAAGGAIILGFSGSALGIILGILMIGKGGFSFI
jgi:hypothetical protein